MSAKPDKAVEFPKEMCLRQRVTPVGEMLFNRLFKGENKQDPTKPKYSTVMLFSKKNETTNALAQEIDGLLKQAVAFVAEKLGKQYDKEGKEKPIKVSDSHPVRVWLEKQPDGSKIPSDKLCFAFSQSSQRTVDGQKVEKLLDIRDKTGTGKWPRSVEIGNGSRGRVFYSVRPYYVPTLGVGVTMGIDAVQIAEARTSTVNVGALDEGDVPEVMDVPETPFSAPPAGTPPTSGGAF